MKKLIILSLTIFVLTSTLAQEKKGFIGVGLGIALPQGDLDKCKTGLSLDILNCGYMFKKDGGFGIGLRWTGNAGEIDSEEDTTWGVGGLYVGPTYSVGVGDNGFVDFKGLIGNTALSASNDNEKVTDNNFGVNIGMNYRHNFHKNWHLIIGVDFQTSSGKFFEVHGDVQCLSLNYGVGFRL